MAKQQCPNCGGFKTYHWMSEWIGESIPVMIVAIVMVTLGTWAGGLGMGLFILGFVGLYGLLKIGEFLFRPKKSHICRICEFNWTPGDAAAKPALKPNLLEMGNALLEREEAAARAAAEEEQYQQEQRRRYGY